MTRFLMGVLFASIAALALGCAPQAQAPDTAAMVAAAEALDKTFVDALNSGDAEAVAACYWNSSEVVTFPPDMLEARGMEAVKDGYVQMMTAMPGAKLEMTESHEMPAGDVVIGWGLWRMTMTGPDGSPMEMSGRYTDVKAERDGKWVYLIDHASVPLPPPPTE